MVIKSFLMCLFLIFFACKNAKKNSPSWEEDAQQTRWACQVSRQQAVELAENEQLELASQGERAENLARLRETFVATVRMVTEGVEVKLVPKEIVKGGGVYIVVDCKTGAVKEKKIIQ